MAISLGTDQIIRILQETNVMGIDSVIGTILMFFILLIITRQITQWTTLAFPVQIALGIAGIKLNLIIFTISIFSFVLTNLSIIVPGAKWKTWKEREIENLTRKAGRKKQIAKLHKDSKLLEDLEMEKRVNKLRGVGKSTYSKAKDWITNIKSKIR